MCFELKKYSLTSMPCLPSTEKWASRTLTPETVNCFQIYWQFKTVLVYLYRFWKRILRKLGSARFVAGFLPEIRGEFSTCIKYLPKRTDKLSYIRAATGCLTAGLHRHISIKAGSLGSYIGALLCDPALFVWIKRKKENIQNDGMEASQRNHLVRRTLSRLFQVNHGGKASGRE